MSDEQELDIVDAGSDEVEDIDLDEDEDRQPESPTKAQERPKVNLDDLPEFRSWKSNTDRRMSQAEQRAAMAERQAAAIRQQWEESYIATLDEVEAANYRATLAEQRLAEREAILAEERNAIQKLRIMDEITRETGAPLDVIEDSADVMDAWKRAYKWERENRGQQSRRKAEQIVDRQERNQVDLGGGSPPTTAGAWQKRYDRAMANFDTGAVMDIIHEAAKAGVTLKE